MTNNYKKLIELLNTAKGKRSLNRFAEECQIDPGHMSRLLRGIMLKPPIPSTLKKIADSAANGVSYEALMCAAGHLVNHEKQDSTGTAELCCKETGMCTKSCCNRLPFMSRDMEEWISNPENLPYLDYIYEAFKSGVTVELLKKAVITIRLEK